MPLGLRFWHNSGGMKRTCWTTGSWRCCISLEVVSSIPTGSTLIYRFLCGFICVSLCKSIKINPQICISRAPERSSKLIHTGVEITTCAFQPGCQLSSAAWGMSLGFWFWRNSGGMKRTCWTTGSSRCCLRLEVVSLIPAGFTFIRGFICVSLCQSLNIKPPNMYMHIYHSGFGNGYHMAAPVPVK